MAASATPMGARPVGSIISCAFNNQVKHYKIKNAYGTSADQDDLGKNAAVVQTAGSTAIGTSKNSVDISTIATTNTLPVKLIEFVDGPDSAVGDAYTDVLVMFNTGHQLLNATGVG